MPCSHWDQRASPVACLRGHARAHPRGSAPRYGFAVVQRDTGLGYEPVLVDPSVCRVTFLPHASSQSANRVAALISRLGRIVLTGLPSSHPGLHATGPIR